MRTTKPTFTTLILTILTLTAHLAAAAPSDQVDLSRGALERFKGLEGSWQGTDAEGNVVSATYEVVADGQTVVERYLNQRDGATQPMVTVYHLAGDRLVLTHYCVAGNQPRMEARSIDDAEVRFELYDITNLATPEAGHMHRAAFRFADADHFSTEWTFRENGEDRFTAKIRLERVAGD